MCSSPPLVFTQSEEYLEKQERSGQGWDIVFSLVDVTLPSAAVSEPSHDMLLSPLHTGHQQAAVPSAL